MRVCMVVANPIVFDGRVVRHAQALEDAGHKVTVLGVRGPNDREGDLPAGCTFTTWRLDRRRRGVLPRLIWAETAARRRLAQRLCERLPPSVLVRLPGIASLAVATSALELLALALAVPCDVYHGNDLDTLPAVAWAAALSRRPYLYDAHELYVDEEPTLTAAERRARALTEGRYSRGAAAVITVNELIADELARLHGIPRPVVIRNLPPRLDFPGSDPAARPLGEAGTLRLLYHGANVGLGQEGTDDVLRAMARLRDQADLHLTIRGRIGAAEEAALFQRVGALGLSGRVRLCPPVPGAPALVQKAVEDREEVGLAVHPPLCGTYRYTTSSKVYEYQMAGLAVCATDVEGNHLTVDRRAGIFYQAGDDAELAGHLLGLAHDRERLRRLQVAARARAVSELCWERERDRLLSIYTDLARELPRDSARRPTPA